jgi:hypothetical protein
MCHIQLALSNPRTAVTNSKIYKISPVDSALTARAASKADFVCAVRACVCVCVCVCGCVCGFVLDLASPFLFRSSSLSLFGKSGVDRAVESSSV